MPFGNTGVNTPFHGATHRPGQHYVTIVFLPKRPILAYRSAIDPRFKRELTDEDLG
jgi:hypothetical protein